jgi:hypothetical protein
MKDLTEFLLNMYMKDMFYQTLQLYTANAMVTATSQLLVHYFSEGLPYTSSSLSSTEPMTGNDSHMTVTEILKIKLCIHSARMHIKLNFTASAKAVL